MKRRFFTDKTLSKPDELANAGFRFGVDGKHFENGAVQ